MDFKIPGCTKLHHAKELHGPPVRAVHYRLPYFVGRRGTWSGSRGTTLLQTEVGGSLLMASPS